MGCPTTDRQIDRHFRTRTAILGLPQRDAQAPAVAAMQPGGAEPMEVEPAEPAHPALSVDETESDAKRRKVEEEPVEPEPVEPEPVEPEPVEPEPVEPEPVEPKSPLLEDWCRSGAGFSPWLVPSVIRATRHFQHALHRGRRPTLFKSLYGALPVDICVHRASEMRAPGSPR